MGKCSYCGKDGDLRPYGRNAALICFECGMAPKNIKETEAQFDAQLAACGGKAGLLGEAGPVPLHSLFGGITFQVVEEGPVFVDGEFIGEIAAFDVLMERGGSVAFCTQETFDALKLELKNTPAKN